MPTVDILIFTFNYDIICKNNDLCNSLVYQCTNVPLSVPHRCIISSGNCTVSSYRLFQRLDEITVFDKAFTVFDKTRVYISTMKSQGDAKNEANNAAQASKAEAAAPVVEEKIDFTGVVIEPLFEDFVDFETFSKSDFRAVKVLACEAVPKSKKLLKFTLDDGTGVNRTILSGIHAFYEPEELVGKTLIAITNLPPRPMMGIDSCGMLLSAINKRGEEEELHLLMVDNHIPAGAKLY